MSLYLKKDNEKDYDENYYNYVKGVFAKMIDLLIKKLWWDYKSILGN